MGGLTAKHPMGCLHPAGSPRCGSVQTCWSKLVTSNSLWAVTTLRAHRVADRSKLAGATLSNRVVLIRRRGPYTKKPHCVQWGFLYMVHSGGFEPPTARFVAGYSIQLSYECFTVSFQRPRTIGGRGGCVNNPWGLLRGFFVPFSSSEELLTAWFL